MEVWNKLLNSYSHPIALGHPSILGLTAQSCIVEEKIDGSQFSFGVIDGELQARSRGAQIYFGGPPDDFKPIITIIQELEARLTPNWIYRGEYLRKPKHNTLHYSRIPNQHVMIFDINTGMETFMTPAGKQSEAVRLGFETVPVLFEGIPTLDLMKELLTTESVLGGVKIEGVVIKPKNYDLFGRDGKVMMGKYVSEQFKETHRAEWDKGKARKGPILDSIINALRTEARWQKAVQHLREAGTITDSPKDIGALIVEIKADILKEEEEWIKERLFKEFIPDVLRGVIRGAPEWYKSKLLEKQFEGASKGFTE